jgi:hypothetical protein
VREDNTVEASEVVITRERLVPRSGGYYRKATGFARRLAGGTVRVKRRRWW